MERTFGTLPTSVDSRVVLSSEPTFKRLFDLCLSAIGLLLSAPLWAVIALAIRLGDGGPIFYRQARVGRDGERFQTLKFRTMIRDAERPGEAKLWTPDDPRVTRVGRWLRATAADELPQLLNILLGHMSFVGPRPERPEFVERFQREVPAYEERLRLRPGLTGLAQVYGHYGSAPRQKLRYDLLYLKRRSLLLDLKLILLSVGISLRGKWEHRNRKR